MIEVYCLIGASVFLSLCAVFAAIFLDASVNGMRKELNYIKQSDKMEAELRKDYIDIIWRLVRDVDTLKKVKKDKKRKVAEKK